MLDQSFSVVNFRQVLDYENKRGNFIEGKYFPEVKRLLGNIARFKKFINSKKGVISFDDYQILEQRVLGKIDELKNERELLLNSKLDELSRKVSAGKFKITLKRNDTILDKPVYLIEDKPEFYFALKQVQYNFKRLYKVKQSNRCLIVSQIRNILNDKLPKVLVRVDIESFYESISHEKLLEKLNEDNLLSYSSKIVIRQVINQYKVLSGDNKGLPRGVGISSYLSEIYMRSFDKVIASLSHVNYYARYVDDIFIVFSSSLSLKPNFYLELVKEILKEKTSLELNTSKSHEFDLVKQRPKFSFNYLGYSFEIDKTEKANKVSLTLPNTKIARYKQKIDLALSSYLMSPIKSQKTARVMLLKRIRFLTGNTRLVNNKDRVMVGVHYSNNLITDVSCFKALDDYLETEVNRLILNPFVSKKILRSSFVKGFLFKRFSPFKPLELQQIVKPWA
jgi:hypothetical protein